MSIMSSMPYKTKNRMLAYIAAFWESRTPAWIYAVTMVPSSAIVLLLAIQPWAPLHDLVVDPLAVVRECLKDADTLAQARRVCHRSHFGFLSNLGIVLWCVSASISLFSSFLVYQASKELKLTAFLLYAGILTGFLLIDDLFQGHEIADSYLKISQVYTGIIYALMTALYVAIFRHQILRSDPKILCLSLVLLAISLIIDMLENVVLYDLKALFHRVAEDGTKFVGIWAWAVFHIRAAWLTISEFCVRTDASQTMEL